jgi:ribosomal-protein-alanine N-acetyltransferase
MELKKWKIEYADSLAKHANNKNIADNLMDAFPHPYNQNNAKEYINYCINLDIESHLYRAIIEDEQAIGCISISLGIDIHSKTAKIAYWLSEDYWNKGIMRKAIKEICDMAFDQLKIVRIYAEVFYYNTASCIVLENGGFVFEGEQKKAISKNEKVYDALMYALTLNNI